MSMIMLDHALSYAAKGYPVFPCKPKNKDPLTGHGFKDATTDEAIIRGWWAKWPEANIGLALEASGLIALDLDRHPGQPDGVEAFTRLRAGQGFSTKPPISISGGYGYHILLKRPPGKLKGEIEKGIDIKDKGYIVLPPSVHPNGQSYQWREGRSLLECGPVNCPEWLLPLLFKTEANTHELPSSRQYPPSSGEVIIQRCPFLRHVAEDASLLPEPDWYYGLGVLAYTVEAPEIVHQYSYLHPGYSVGDTDDKLAHWKKDGKAPPTCRTIQEKCGDEYCKACPYNGNIKSPIVLGHASRPAQNQGIRQPFPVEVLPGIFQRFAVSTATAMQCPVDYVACALLVVVSILIGGKRLIQLEPEWQQRANLWLVLLGTPSSKKSPALEKALKPLRDIEAALTKKYKKESAQYEVALRQYEVELKNWKAEPVGDAPLKPIKPKLERLTTSDTTVEALGKLLSENSHGVAVACDELSAWARSMNQYKGGKGADRSHYLAMWSNSRMTIDRKKEDPIVVEAPYLSLIGGLQPDLLLELSNQGSEDGMKERLLYCFPLPNKELPQTGQKIPAELHTAMADLCQKIFDERPKQGRLTIPLSENAQQVFLQARQEWHGLIHSEGFQSEREAYYSKMPRHLASLALILHEMKRVDGVLDDEVSAVTMQEAKALADYFLNHAQAALGLITQTHEEQRVEKAAQWIQKKGLVVVSARHLMTNRVAGCRKTPEAKALLQALQDYGYGYWQAETGRLVFFQESVSMSAVGAKD